ncbi:hypothetical protein AB0O75_15850 [Streptomyces sp. NPDC088921]|uniref:hypothetical protein n=1 Tax=Streptomyces sp. NPDC088921 TaxID=3155062 RepID=UPI003429C92F
MQPVPAARAATGSGAQQTLRHIGSCAGVALTIEIAAASASTADTTSVVALREQ